MQKAAHFTPLVGLLVLMLPASAQAEVMDKEPAPSLIWASAIVAGVVGMQLWRTRWWLGLPASIAATLLFARVWAEILDPFVGPAIRAEAGIGYIESTAAATMLVAVLHVLGALRRRKFGGRRVG